MLIKTFIPLIFVYYRTLESHFAKESKIEAKVNPIIMKKSSHSYAANELKQPHTASSFFRTQR